MELTEQDLRMLEEVADHMTRQLIPGAESPYDQWELLERFDNFLKQKEDNEHAP